MQAPPEELATLLRQRYGMPTPDCWAALPGGQTNRSWRVVVAGSAWVVKLFAGDTGNPLFPNDARDEARMLRLLSPTGLAPELIDEVVTSCGPCLIYRHVEGTAWHEDPATAAKALAELHRQDPPEGLRRLEPGSDRLTTQTEAIIARLPDRDRNNLLALLPEGSAASEGPTVLLHGDPVPGNMIVERSRVTLIDWQCPAIGDPVEDLSIFMSPAMQLIYRGRPLSKAEKTAFIDAYGDPDIRGRIEHLAPWHHWRMAAYCTWKVLQGQQEYKAAGELEIAALTA
ncbi:MAG: aminoglycoside phosphotransferase family protein [Thalassovita sp.]|nr:aminoglycoside phosphotransferase family protein [Thalassovita sp.]